MSSEISSALQAGTAGTQSQPPAPGVPANYSECCPTCGAALRDLVNWDSETRTFIANRRSVRFTRVEALMIDALWRRRKHGPIESLTQFAEMAWSSDADGGPESASNCISIHVAHIRKKLQATGYTVTANRGRPKQGFKLIKLEAQ